MDLIWQILANNVEKILLLIPWLRGRYMSWLRGRNPPDFTLCQLRDYAAGIVTKKVEEEWDQGPGIEVSIQFVRLPDCLHSSLFKRKIRAWGRECKDGVLSSEGLVSIHPSYWKFNQINRKLFELPLPSSEEFATLVSLGMADEIIRHSDSEPIYKEIRFNRKQVLELVEEYFTV